MSTLNMDLIFVEILPRLPAKSLLRFKCVSKSFHAAISSRDFVKLHLRCVSPSSGANNLFAIPGIRSIVCYNLDSRHLFTRISSFVWYSGSISVVGSSNGLLCISVVNDINRLFVLNPTTHMSKNVNIPSIRERGHNLGFAFDHTNLDYKIVTISDNNDRSHCDIRTTRVYSLNSKTWRTVEISVPMDSMNGRRDGVLIDSHLLHWIFWNPSRKARIGCFDVCTMKWANDVRLPRYYYDLNHDNHLLELGVFDDQLFASLKNQINSCFDVWVMKEYGVRDSWFKLWSIPISDDLRAGVVPIASDKLSNEILIRQGPSSTLFWYNSRNGGMRVAEFLEPPNSPNLQVYICTQSLVDIPCAELFWSIR